MRPAAVRLSALLRRVLRPLCAPASWSRARSSGSRVPSRPSAAPRRSRASA
ncbi:hypothetical protein ACFPRL_32200 [Pseudoclavibacter helvolus]